MPIPRRHSCIFCFTEQDTSRRQDGYEEGKWWLIDRTTETHAHHCPCLHGVIFLFLLLVPSFLPLPSVLPSSSVPPTLRDTACTFVCLSCYSFLCLNQIHLSQSWLLLAGRNWVEYPHSSTSKSQLYILKKTENKPHRMKSVSLAAVAGLSLPLFLFADFAAATPAPAPGVIVERGKVFLSLYSSHLQITNESNPQHQMTISVAWAGITDRP